MYFCLSVIPHLAGNGPKVRRKRKRFRTATKINKSSSKNLGYASTLINLNDGMLHPNAAVSLPA